MKYNEIMFDPNYSIPHCNDLGINQGSEKPKTIKQPVVKDTSD